MPRVALLKERYLGCGAARKAQPMNQLSFISTLLLVVQVLAKTNPRGMLASRNRGRRWNGAVDEGFSQQLAGRIYHSTPQRTVPLHTSTRKVVAPGSEEWEEFGEDV